MIVFILVIPKIHISATRCEAEEQTIDVHPEVEVLLVSTSALDQEVEGTDFTDLVIAFIMYCRHSLKHRGRTKSLSSLCDFIP